MTKPFAATFFVPGRPVPQPRPRVFNGIAVSNLGPVVGWKKSIALIAKTKAPRKPLTGPLQVHLRFLYAVPKKGQPKAGKPHSSRPDADNLAKALLDGMDKCGYWLDDAQVAVLVVEKRYCPEYLEPGVQVYVVEIDENNP